MMQSSSPGTASETWAQSGAARTGMQPDGDTSCRANCGFELAFRLINDLVLNYASVRLGRFTKHFGFEGFNITNSVPDLGTNFEKYRSARFSSPALQRRFADLPALGQFGLGHASSIHALHPFAGVVRTPMKALGAEKVKVGVFSLGFCA
jgi:hypothetical protein